MMRLACAVSLLSAGQRSLGMRFLGVVLVAMLSLVSTGVTAQTIVSQDISGDTHWVTTGSPYVVSGPLSIRGGATLTIDAGVRVSMAAGASLTVQGGSVRANGTLDSPVLVQSDKTRLSQVAAPGDWGQWVFLPGTVNTRLEHVLFEHGKGLVVNGSAPVFNFVNIRNQQGVAMTIDLAASPSGVGNQATGNTLNGISVPAGDLVGNVRWGLRGIPYVVTAGTVSVGASPRIASVSPTVVEVGQTVTLTVNGSRLAGLSSSTFDRAGLTLTPFSGGNASQLFLQLKVDSTTVPGVANLRLQVDAGELLLPNAVTVTLPVPTLTSIEPTSVFARSGAVEVTVKGRNFVAASEVTFNTASAATRYVSPTELRATLLNQTAAGTLQVAVRSPDTAAPGQYVTSNALSMTVQPAVPPTVAIEPAPIALPPDGSPREITLRLSKPDQIAHTLLLSVSDATKATVSPASLTIPAGQTTAKITITPLLAGTVSLIADSSTLARVTAPLFITTDFRGANTSYAAPVGVVVTPTPGSDQETRAVTVVDSPVGVSVGAVLTGASPSAWTLGSTTALTVRGVGIPANAQVSLLPSTGVTLGSPIISADGSQLQVNITTAADAPLGMRRVVVKDGAGNVLTFTSANRAMVQILTALPSIESIDPVVAVRGRLVKMTVRGRDLQQGSLRLVPDSGARIDSVAEVSQDGRTLSTWIDLAADALVGPRTVQVVTPAGVSSGDAQPANTLSVVAASSGAVTPIASPMVGVVVGSASTAEPGTVHPGSGLVGVLLGAGVAEVTPRVGVIGNDVTVTVRGSGLQSVTAVALRPADGVTVLAGPTANAAGTELTFSLRIDAQAAIGVRRLSLQTASGVPLVTARPFDSTFLVSAPVPELASVAPQVIVAGQPTVRMTVRGRNFINVADARIEPADGVTVSGPFETDAQGTTLTFNVSVAAGSAAGARTVIVSSAAGQSTAEQQAGNLVRISSQVGPTYADIVSASVGVQVGAASPVTPEVPASLLVSSSVGIVVGAAAEAPEPVSSTLASLPIRVVVGQAAYTMSPSGWLQGSSGAITVTGIGLDAVTRVSVLPATGLLLESPTIGSGGTTLSLPLSVAPDAPQVVRELRLHTATGEFLFSRPEVPRFGIGSMPSLTSVSPIVFEQGKGVKLTIRGSNLKGVNGVSFAPAAGVRAVSEVTWSTDALGEFINVTVQVDPTAAQGNRVLRLDVHGGSTTEVPSSANTINVVAPQ